MHLSSRDECSRSGKRCDSQVKCETLQRLNLLPRVRCLIMLIAALPNFARICEFHNGVRHQHAEVTCFTRRELAIALTTMIHDRDQPF